MPRQAHLAARELGARPGLPATRPGPSQALIDWIEDDLLLGKRWQVRDGGVRLPDVPGLGVEIDKEALERYADRS